MDSPHVREVIQDFGDRLHTQVETFGIGDDAKWQARDVAYRNDATHFRVFRAGAEWGQFSTSLIGDFNVRNCLAVIIAADAWGVDRERIAGALATFKSVKRRAEVRGVVRGITVIDDSRITRRPCGKRSRPSSKNTRGIAIAVFEPRSWSSRLAVFQKITSPPSVSRTTR
ncbi:MAG: Mur ligase family protein [Pyrinomonadaceae bacterium]